MDKINQNKHEKVKFKTKLQVTIIINIIHTQTNI